MTNSLEIFNIEFQYFNELYAKKTTENIDVNAGLETSKVSQKYTKLCRQLKKLKPLISRLIIHCLNSSFQIQKRQNGREINSELILTGDKKV